MHIVVLQSHAGRALSISRMHLTVSRVYLQTCIRLCRARRAKAAAAAAAAGDSSNYRALPPAAAAFTVLDIEGAPSVKRVPTCAWEKVTTCLFGLRGLSGESPHN